MIVGNVVGNVWATRKEESLNGLKLMVVQPVDPVSGEQRPCLIAADQVGAGIGETVLVTTGSSARQALGKGAVPVDASIVGIIDQVDIP
ncbi:EutN/CcmL family microcompartment protein [Desulfobulbus rhabdoformis]|jgi:ethanolamine utilization protein EutN|uniref:EutN/CcmL family microcompartment protein n=1 Tax=Desulfobulbus rhabdoformis TaxID=34032 RepID=UPI001964374A|nr:EutN/CcmL family microcompartment protein [Desulfobulbus rhabdoformis]MBM9613753.1 EutN/CcmL family microcompartment protein [Desulfobulbus rhabdoformis]